MLKNLGIAGGLGALLGLALIWWLEPSNAGGIGLLLFIPTVVCTTLGGILSLLLGKQKEPDDKKESGSTSHSKNRDDDA